MAYPSITHCPSLNLPSTLHHHTICPAPNVKLLIADVTRLELDGSNFLLWEWQHKVIIRYLTNLSTTYLDSPSQVSANNPKLDELVFCMITWSLHPELQVTVDLNSSSKQAFQALKGRFYHGNLSASRTTVYTAPEESKNHEISAIQTQPSVQTTHQQVGEKAEVSKSSTYSINLLMAQQSPIA